MSQQDSITTPTADQQVFRLLADAIHHHLPADSINEDRVREIVGEQIAQATLPRPVEVHFPDGQTNQVNGTVHQQFEEVLSLIEEGHKNVLMVGPAGSGKTTLAKNVAEGLGLDFGFISLSQGVTESHLLGRLLPQADGSWQYQPSRFVEIFENGGVFLLDEIDAADANLMVSINAALANGILANPNGRIHKRHPQTYIIAAANTWGRGADSSYVGRNALDASTLDRFVMSTAYVDYDQQLEQQIVAPLKPAQRSALTDWIWGLREKIKSHKLRRIASTRLLAGCVSAIQAGRSLDQVKQRYFRNWTQDEIAKVGN